MWSSSDCKSFYRYVKRKRLVKTNVGPLQLELGEFIMDNKEMEEQLNKYFGSVFTKEDTNKLQEMLRDRRSSIKKELKEILMSQDMDVTSRMDKGESVDVVYLDFQKAFDKRLVRKIKPHDDTKLGGSVCCGEDAKRLKGDFDRLAEWANIGQMQYNVDKCE
eukprot:g37288.t1